MAGIRYAFALLLTVLLSLAGNCPCAASADQLIVPDSSRRTERINSIFRLDQPVSGRGSLDEKWTDVLGRVVDRRRIRLNLSNTRDVRFSLDLSRAVTVGNTITVHLLLGSSSSPRAGEAHQHRASTSFYVAPARPPWSDFQIIMWQSQTPAAYRALRHLGVTAVAVGSDRREEPGQSVLDDAKTVLDADLGWYFENAATDFYSAYHRWFPDHPPSWRFDEVKHRYWANAGDPTVFFREPSLSDPAWIAKIGARLKNDVRVLHRFRPLFYNLADEPGIADLAAAWDFDRSPLSLAAMCDWLKRKYGSLNRLNNEWGSAFPSWDKVVPMTTNGALKRSDQNFASWGDFKTWMDVAFARALRNGTDALHAADPRSLSAIEGGQIPGWGGYDYTRLADSVDAMELYDDGENVEIVRSLNASNITLTTSFESGPAEEHRVWRELLRGTRGVILWDSKHEFVDKDGMLGQRGHMAVPYFCEIRDGLGALLINSRRHDDPIAILYSPMSLKIEWLLNRIRSGEDWTKRDAAAEWDDTPIRSSTAKFTSAFRHRGLQHRFISEEQLAAGELKRAGYKMLVLPHTISLSDQAAESIRQFVRRGGTVLVDREAGDFDEHGRRRAVPILRQLLQTKPWDGPAVRFGRGRAIQLPAPRAGDTQGRNRLADALAEAGISPMFRLTRPDGGIVNDVETFIFTYGETILIALLRDLKEGGKEPGQPETVELHLPAAYEIYNVRQPGPPTRAKRLSLKLDAISPTILAISQRQLAAPMIAGPSTARAGEKAEFRIGWEDKARSERDLVRIQVIDPDGAPVPYYGDNLPIIGGWARYQLPLAVNDKPGTWVIQARDVITAVTATARFTVRP